MLARAGSNGIAFAKHCPPSLDSAYLNTRNRGSLVFSRVHRHRHRGPCWPAISHCSSSWSPATMTAFARLPPKVASNTNAELSSPPKLLKCVEVYPPDPVL
uniref:Uncharacterized protein n=1 Tax=Oryza meridionalis TaxID=40149 RepID=A0A0E0E596_9ORYZ